MSRIHHTDAGPLAAEAALKDWRRAQAALEQRRPSLVLDAYISGRPSLARVAKLLDVSTAVVRSDLARYGIDPKTYTRDPLAQNLARAVVGFARYVEEHLPPNTATHLLSWETASALTEVRVDAGEAHQKFGWTRRELTDLAQAMLDAAIDNTVDAQALEPAREAISAASPSSPPTPSPADRPRPGVDPALRQAIALGGCGGADGEVTAAGSFQAKIGATGATAPAQCPSTRDVTARVSGRGARRGCGRNATGALRTVGCRWCTLRDTGARRGSCARRVPDRRNHAARRSSSFGRENSDRSSRDRRWSGSPSFGIPRGYTCSSHPHGSSTWRWAGQRASRARVPEYGCWNGR